MQKYDLYLNQILESIEKIEKSLRKKTEDDLENNEELKDANYMRMQIIGENIGKIPIKFKNKYA